MRITTRDMLDMQHTVAVNKALVHISSLSLTSSLSQKRTRFFSLSESLSLSISLSL